MSDSDIDDTPQNIKNEAEKKHTHSNYREKSVEELQNMLDCPTVSKNQKKKIAKQLKWFNLADERKEQRKRKKLEYKEKNKISGKKRKKLEKVTTSDNFENFIHVAIDFSFYDLMQNRDLRKLGKQIGWCYKENRRAMCPVQYHLCGMSDRLKSNLDPSYLNWDVHFDGNIYERFSSDQLVYLTAESSNTLDKLFPGKVYVIGGLVDHNHQKGICEKNANEKKIKTARLPLDENINIKTRRVLTVNHVFEILLAFAELKDWKKAILKVLPSRKISDCKSLINSENNGGNSTDLNGSVHKTDITKEVSDE